MDSVSESTYYWALNLVLKLIIKIVCFITRKTLRNKTAAIIVYFYYIVFASVIIIFSTIYRWIFLLSTDGSFYYAGTHDRNSHDPNDDFDLSGLSSKYLMKYVRSIDPIPSSPERSSIKLTTHPQRWDQLCLNRLTATLFENLFVFPKKFYDLIQ